MSRPAASPEDWDIREVPEEEDDFQDDLDLRTHFPEDFPCPSYFEA